MSSIPQQVVVQAQWVSRYFDQPGFALTKVNLEIYRGEVFGLLGPAGSGKSTLMRIWAGRLSPSEGKAKVLGRSPNRRAVRARVGYLPQNSNDRRSHVLSEVVDFLKEAFWLTKIGFRKSKPSHAEENDRHKHLRQILLKNPEVVLLDDPFSEMRDPTDRDEGARIHTRS